MKDSKFKDQSKINIQTRPMQMIAASAINTVFILFFLLHLKNLQYRKSDTRYTTHPTIAIGHITPTNMLHNTSSMSNLSKQANFDRMMVAVAMATTIAMIEYISTTIEITSISIFFL